MSGYSPDISAISANISTVKANVATMLARIPSTVALATDVTVIEATQALQALDATVAKSASTPANSTTAENSAKVTITSGVANVYGTWVQLIAASAQGSEGFLVTYVCDSNGTYIIDIGSGAGGSEVTLFSIVALGTAVGGDMASVFIPITKVSNIRYAARCQDTAGSGTARVILTLAE